MAEATENRVRFGLSGVHIAPRTGEGTYGAPIEIPGAVNLSASPEGNSDKFYADNIPFYTAITNAGYSGDLELAIIPDAVKAAIGLGFIDDNGAFVEDADLVAVPFALLFEVNGDAKNRRSIFYSCTAQRPSDEHKTKEDGTSVTTEKLSLTMIPEPLDGKNITKLSIEPSTENKVVYDKFFTAVIKPNEPTEA